MLIHFCIPGEIGCKIQVVALNHGDQKPCQYFQFTFKKFQYQINHKITGFLLFRGKLSFFPEEGTVVHQGQGPLIIDQQGLLQVM